MIGWPPSVRVFFATHPADMRRSFDGLLALARTVVAENPLSGHLFVFRNRGGDRVKVLYWDRTGLCIWYKRLEKGTFAFPAPGGDSKHVEMSAADMMLVLEGVDLSRVRRLEPFLVAEKRS